jgi:hypothetical protein
MKLTVHLSFGIPHEDAAEYAMLPQITRDHVSWMLDVMKSVAAAGKGKQVAACRQIAEAADKSTNTIYNAWKAFRSSGDWRVLIDKRYTSEFWQRDPSKRVGLPPLFIEMEWKRRCDENQRAFKPAWRILIDDWRKWRNGDLTKAMKGYDRAPEPAPGSRFPRGWNYSNLLQYVPDDVELAACREGRTSALKLTPGIRSTRAGSFEAGLAGPFRDVEFDDMWHDFEVNVIGQKTACRLLEFGAVDSFTTYIFNPGLKPRIRNMETGRMQALNERDFHLYVINWILDHGIHPLGTTFHVENGTARISKAFAEKLMMWFPGLKIQSGGMSGAPAFAGAYRERAKGNPNSKAIKEGLGKLIHNQTAHLPGQVGMNRDNLPASHAGRDRENETMLAIAAQLPQLRNTLQFGFLDFPEAVHAVNEIYALLNCREDHQIEGWAECGGVVDMFRFSTKSDDWRPLADVNDLPENERFALSMTLKLDPGLKQLRTLSPAQMLLSHGTRLLKLPDEAIPDLLGQHYGQILPINGGIIAFRQPGLGKLRFKAIYQDRDGFRRRVSNGESILAHLNPWKPDFIYLSDAKTGRYLGKADRDYAHTRGDTEATQRAHGRAQADFKDSLHDLVARQGLTRIPHMQRNTQAVRAAAAPSARDQALAASDFGADAMLDADDDDLATTTATGPAFYDPADLL